jgi:hypothetical protein
VKVVVLTAQYVDSEHEFLYSVFRLHVEIYDAFALL